MQISVSGVWSGLPEEIARELTANAAAHFLKAGQVLFDEGEKGDGCYRLDKGVLKVSLKSPQGAERIIAVLSKGAIVGDLAMIDELPRSASVVALTDCELRFISRASFQECAERHPEIYKFLVRLLARRLRETDDTIAALAFLTAEGRVANALLDLADVLGERAEDRVLIPTMVSQKDLAALAGVARENTNRILKRLQDKKVFAKSARAYEIDVTKLQQELAWQE